MQTPSGGVALLTTVPLDSSSRSARHIPRALSIRVYNIVAGYITTTHTLAFGLGLICSQNRIKMMGNCIILWLLLP